MSILDFVGQEVSVTTIQLCHCSRNEALGNVYINELAVS